MDSSMVGMTMVVAPALIAWCYLVFRSRSSAEVLSGISHLSPESLISSGKVDAECSEPRLSRERGDSGRARNGYEGPRQTVRKQAKALPLLWGALCAVALLTLNSSAQAVIAAGVFGVAACYLFQRVKGKKRQAGYIRQIEFFLPVVMERLVMAVQAGLDIVPAVKALLELDEDDRRTGFRNADPVSHSLGVAIGLTESGLGFERALKEVAAHVDCVALKHAFLHLAVAQKEGGEIVAPLKELSDSTQLYYQDVIEEEIAKMPVKATLPLLCTFAGLLVCFISSPLIQVLGMTSKAFIK